MKGEGEITKLSEENSEQNTKSAGMMLKNFRATYKSKRKIGSRFFKWARNRNSRVET